MDPKEPKEPKEPQEPKEPKEPKEEDYVSRETYDKLEQKSKELEKKVKKLEQTILHANVEKKDENPFKGFSRYE
nr:MAG TPA: Membrane fusogenic activity protein [Caudoviricetes sp.]